MGFLLCILFVMLVVVKVEEDYAEFHRMYTYDNPCSMTFAIYNHIYHVIILFLNVVFCGELLYKVVL